MSSPSVDSTPDKFRGEGSFSSRSPSSSSSPESSRGALETSDPVVHDSSAHGTVETASTAATLPSMENTAEEVVIVAVATAEPELNIILGLV